MAKQPQNQSAQPEPGDPLFNLKHAEAEAALGTDAAAINEAINEDGPEDDNLDEGPRDKQGNRRGENDSAIGSTAGKH